MLRSGIVKVSVYLMIVTFFFKVAVGPEASGAQLRKNSEIDANTSLHSAWRNASKALDSTPEITLKYWERYKKDIDASTAMVQFMWYELADKANRKLDRYPRATEIALQLVEISQSLSSAYRGKAFNLLGISLRHLYAYPLAAQSYQCAIKHYPPSHRKLASVYNNLAIVQQRMGHLESSISLFQQAILIGQQHSDTPQNTYLTNLAIISSRAGFHENAVNYLKQAMFLENTDVTDEKRLKSLTYLLFSLTELKDWIQVDRISREIERRSVLATETGTHLLYEWVQIHYQFQRFNKKPVAETLQRLISEYEKAGHSGAQFIYERVASTMSLTISKDSKPDPQQLAEPLKLKVVPIIDSCGASQS